MLRKQHYCSLPIFSLPQSWHFFQQNIQFDTSFNSMQWTSENCLSEERISNPTNSLWQAGLFRYQVHELTKTRQKLSNIRLWINLCPRGNLQRHKYKNLDWEQVPISVSISSNLVEEPILLCNSDPHHLVASFIGTPENLASQSKAKRKTLFFDIKTKKN